jgi:hypothetical protein
MFRSLRLAFALLCFCTVAWAAPAAGDDSIPAVLRDWRAWVLKGLDYRACPFVSTVTTSEPSGYVCAWPGRLSLAATGDGATFTVHWRVDAPSWVALPGDEQNWPQAVTANGQHQAVLSHEGIPAMWLVPGSYEITGRIPWHDRPQSLHVPAAIGLVALSVDGKTVSPVQRDEDAVTLGRAATTAPEADSLDLRAFRLLVDGVPAELTTQIRLVVSGQAREEVLGPVLPAGFAATALDGDWPARLDSDGRLHVQVQPGSATLTVRARAVAPLATVAARVPAAPWPKQEIWSYESASRLRVTSAKAAISVDPKQAQVPDEWDALPAFALGDGEKLAIEERSRGLAPDESNRLSLRREAWLDFDGSGWYARDYVAGTMVQGWRFDVAAPYALERAEANAMPGQPAEPLLITHGSTPNLSGVEWRMPSVGLAGGVRIAAASTLPVSGWQQNFDRIDTTLHLPFGYQLLAAPGADNVQGSWISRWRLLDVFIAAIVALLAWRLLGVVGALAATGYLLLGYHEEAPIWTLAAVLALSLIVRALPAGRLRGAGVWLRRIAWVALALVALPFVADEVRYALYPQLEHTSVFAAPYGGGPYLNADALGEVSPQQYAYSVAGAKDAELRADLKKMAPPPPPPASAPMVQAMNASPKVARDKGASLETIMVTGSKLSKAATIDHYSQSTVMQTGGGEPRWNLGSTIYLGWAGPVLPTQTVRLVVAPPWIVRPLRIVLALLLVWLAIGAFRALPARPRGPLPGTATAASLMAIGLTMTTVMFAAPAARAQALPGDELLKQLRERLIEAPRCTPGCAAIAQAQIEAAGDQVTVVLEVHTGERLALPLPGTDASASLKSAKVDNAADAPVARANGAEWIAIDRGVHRVELVYGADADRLSLNFGLKPARASFAGKGWSASGIEDDRLLSGTLSIARAKGEGGGDKGETGAQQFAPYVRVVRSLTLGLDWTVETQAQRLSPATSGFTLSLPLLAGEHVSTPGIKVQNADGKGATATIAVADSNAEATWNSTLDKGDSLTLTAPALSEHAEVWRVLVSPTWHVEFSGVPVVGSEAGENPYEFRTMEFYPLPGETLTLKITRPESTQGAVRAIDAVTINTQVGQRSTTQTLAFSLRASQGGEQTVTLPAAAEVLSVKRDAEALNLRARAGKLTLPVKPGNQRFEVVFREGGEATFVSRTPALALGLAAANIDLGLQLPADRWLLLTTGPATGPAVLYWGELVVLVAIAWVLARTRRTKLRFVDWLLLGLGFSTFSWGALLIVVGWLFAFDWRARSQVPPQRWRFNGIQVGLVALTVLALLALVSAIPQGLLGEPDMSVVGNGSSATALRWFADRSSDAMPQATVVSVPTWVYKVLMLAWALWLANALIGWLREAFAAWTRDGYWKAAPAKAIPAGNAPDAAQPAEGAPAGRHGALAADDPGANGPGAAGGS